MSLPNTQKSANLLLSIFLILILLLSLGGYELYNYQKGNITIEKHNELAAIGKLKVDQIINWRNERLENARNIFYNQAIIIHINEYIHGVNRDDNHLTITRFFNSILHEPDYSTVFLLDPIGKIVINTNPAEPLSETGKQIIEKAKKSKEIVFSDLLKYNDQNICIDVAIPLYLNPEQHEGFSGVVLVRIDPDKFFYPLILKWPLPSRTSEIMLIRQEGDKILFLSELQHKKSSALRLHRSLNDTSNYIIKAVVGKQGILEGTDYRGVKVLGDTRAVLGSPWYVVTKIDIDEIYHPIATLATLILIITLLLILISACIIYVVWARQISKSDQERLVMLKHFDYVVKYASDIICLADLEGNIKEANDKAVDTYGYAHDEMLKLNFSQLRPAETNDTFIQQLKLLNESNGSLYETTHINKNGEIFPIEVSGKIMVISGVKYIQVIIRDITDRKQSEKRLHAASKYNRSLLEASLDSLVTIGPDGKITDVNDATENMIGYHREKLIGTDFSDYFTDPANARSVYQEVFREGTVRDYPLEIQHTDGHVTAVLYNSSLYKDENGQVAGVFAAARDITDRKKAEEGIKSLNAELEHRVYERTFQLQAANKELEAFSYSVSHDLRAPLRSIDGWSMALLEDCSDQLDEQGHLYLDRVRNETQRMGLLIDDLLKLSRVSLTELRKVEVDLTLLAQDITSRLMKAPTDRRFEFIIQPGMITLGDPNMLEIALTNLLDNAFKFTSRQPLAKIEFGQSLIGEKQTYWVRDNGVGFDMSYSKNLFGAFQRLHKQSEFPGTGIGLATVQRIIHRHDGRIWAESALNKGATFFFTLIQETL